MTDHDWKRKWTFDTAALSDGEARELDAYFQEAMASAWGQGYKSGHECVGSEPDCNRIKNPYRSES